ncbi:unnamed protein product [Blepharisma stoltei]|uniref:J domain-containing protein n=1 Tax=Blepharisma stoltei TaxID=1481888 RepID=A0AAU9JZZ3_9CILI|nr:unnamed protein product [Blepharisma stoltei]
MNKDEADKCRELGFQALKAKDFDKAIRFFQKAVKFDPSHENQSYLTLAEEKKAKHGAAQQEETKAPEEAKTPTYTPHQEELCHKILSKEDFYEILGVNKDASLDDIKKAYKKLALKLHPDKNQHPKATEAFKKVNRAFSCLSDETKRRTYDQTGHEETPQSGVPQNFDTMFAEHIFQEFFGESFFMPRGGFHYTNVHFPNGNAYYQQRGQNQQNRQRQGYLPLLQLMPVILLLLISVISTYQSQGDYFSFHPTREYSYEKYTRNLNVKYYVEPSYARELRQDMSELQRLESQVEKTYLGQLKRECSNAKEKKSILLNKAKYYSGRSSSYYKEMAEGVDMWSCEKLQELLKT